LYLAEAESDALFTVGLAVTVLDILTLPSLRTAVFRVSTTRWHAVGAQIFTSVRVFKSDTQDIRVFAWLWIVLGLLLDAWFAVFALGRLTFLKF